MKKISRKMIEEVVRKALKESSFIDDKVGKLRAIKADRNRDPNEKKIEMSKLVYQWVKQGDISFKEFLYLMSSFRDAFGI